MNTYALSFNSVGVVHNMILDNITQLNRFPDYSNRDADLVGRQTIANILGCQETEFYQLGTDDSKINIFIEMVKDGNDFDEIFEYICKCYSISGKLKDFFQSLIKELIETNNLREIQALAIQFALQIKKDDELEEAEELIMSSLVSILFHSANYWHDVANNPYNSWNNLFFDNNTIGLARRKKNGWFKRVLRKIGADLLGGFVGGAAFLAFGPAAALVGIAVVGAGASSADGESGDG